MEMKIKLTLLQAPFKESAVFTSHTLPQTLTLNLQPLHIQELQKGPISIRLQGD